MLKIRKAKLADALGMAQVVKEGLKNKNWLYTGSNKYDLNKFKKLAEAEIAIKNVASWKMALRCGFNIEGTKKKALLTDDGKYIDTYIVGKIL